MNDSTDRTENVSNVKNTIEAELRNPYSTIQNQI